MSITEERDARNTMERLKVKVDVLIEQIEDTLGSDLCACTSEENREHRNSLG